MRPPLELAWETPPAWARAALAEPELLLADHAQCELGAAAAAQSLIARSPGRPALVDRLAALAAEEMRHFRRVHRLLVARGGRLLPARPNPYVAGLFALARHAREQRLCDRLLLAALVERRSHERFELLARAASGTELGLLYERLGPSEAGHGTLFVELAHDLAGAAALARLGELARAEGELVRRLPFDHRVHSGPPAAPARRPPARERVAPTR